MFLLLSIPLRKTVNEQGRKLVQNSCQPRLKVSFDFVIEDIAIWWKCIQPCLKITSHLLLLCDEWYKKCTYCSTRLFENVIFVPSTLTRFWSARRLFSSSSSCSSVMATCTGAIVPPTLLYMAHSLLVLMWPIWPHAPHFNCNYTKQTRMICSMYV